MTVLLLAAVVLAWLAVAAVMLAACAMAGRTDRRSLTAHRGRALPAELRVIQRELVGR